MEKKKIKVFEFNKVELETVTGQPELHDISKLIGNVYYQSTADIGQLDKARDIYHTGKAELDEMDQEIFFRSMMMSDLIPAPVKVAIKKMFEK